MGRLKTQQIVTDDRIGWARSLSEADLRAIAADYLRGDRDECAVDGYREYVRRFGAPPSRRGPKPK